MKKNWLFSLGLIFFVASHQQDVLARPIARPQLNRIALIPFSANGKGAHAVAVTASSAMSKALKRQKKLKFIMLPEKRGADLRTCLQDRACVKKLGQGLRADYFITGHVEKQTSLFFMDIRVISSSTSDVIISEMIRVPNANAAKKRSPQFAAKIQGAIKKSQKTYAKSDAKEKKFVTSDNSDVLARSGPGDEENPLTNKKPAPPPQPKQLDSTLAKDSAADAMAEKEAKKGPSLVSQLVSKRYWPAWAAAGAGLTALGVGITFGVVSSNANSTAQETTSQPEAVINHDKAEKNALVANIMYGISGGAFIASAVLFYLEHRKETSESYAGLPINLTWNVSGKGYALMLEGRF